MPTFGSDLGIAFYYYSSGRTTMQRFNLFILVLAVGVVAANAESLCQRLAAGKGSQKAFVQQLMGLTMSSITNDATLAPFFNGEAHDRDGHNVTNYVGNNTLYQQLIDSHVKYFGKLFNCTDSSIPQYNGPSMEAAHAKLEVSASLFEQYQILSMDVLPIAALGKVTTDVEIEVSELFEQHRGAVAEAQICNEADCKLATLTLDTWDEFYPMFLNLEQGQSLTISNMNTMATNFTLLNITGDGVCSPMGSIITVGAGSNVATAAIGALPAGDYYFGAWPSSCALHMASISPMISLIRVHAAVVAPVQAPVEAPVEPPVQAPVKPPVKPPVQAPVKPPVQPPVKSPQQAPVASPSGETPTSTPSVSSPAAQPIAAPESHENGHDLTPVVIVLSIAVAVLLGVVIFLIFKLKKKEPHYEIIND